MKIALIAACIAGAALSLPAYAGDDHKAGTIEEKIAHLDTNKDGAVSHDEHDAAWDHKFKEADADHNGTLSAAEKTAKHIEIKGAAADGAVTHDEFHAAAEAKFTAADTNHDKSLSKDELTAAWKAHH